MRFPDVIQDLNNLGRRLRALEVDFEFHHSQFRKAVFHVKQLAELLETNEPSEGAAATLVAACNDLEKVLNGSQETIVGQTVIPLP